MSPDDRSKYDNEDNYEDDLFKKYSFNEDKDKNQDYEDEDEIINTGRHAKRFPEDERHFPAEESREQIEDDFFTDRDFEFRNADGDEWDDDGARSTRIREKRKKRRIIFTSITVMILLVLLSIGIVFGYRFIKNKYFSDTTESQSTQAETSIEIPSSIKLGRDLSIIIAGADSNLLEPQIKSLILSKYTVSDSRLVSLCMPVNALFDIPGFGQDIISKAVGFGGMDLMKLAVKNNLGVDAENYLLMDQWRTFMICGAPGESVLKLDFTVTQCPEYDTCRVYRFRFNLAHDAVTADLRDGLREKLVVLRVCKMHGDHGVIQVFGSLKPCVVPVFPAISIQVSQLWLEYRCGDITARYHHCRQTR